jgi:Zn-dependent protease with chaperone function
MNALLVVAFSLALFLGTAYVLGWVCAELGERVGGRLSTSSRFRAAMAFVPIATAAGLALSVLSPQAILDRCHCVSHPHHLHLCLEHATFSWALVAAGIVGLAGLIPRARALLALARDYGMTASWASALRTSTRLEVGGTRVEIVDAAGAHSWTFGVGRPRVVVCRSLWSCLDDDARSAVVAHERAHLARRDPLTLILVRAAGCFLSADAADRILRGWRRAAELACDRLAARWVGDAGTVAAALVACGRLQLLESSDTRAALGIVNDDLELRVRTLLESGSQPPAVPPGNGDLASAVSVAIAGLVFVAVVAGHSAHHALETVLSWVS